jgi:phosphorylcholine metabolism protein LicD
MTRKDYIKIAKIIKDSTSKGCKLLNDESKATNKHLIIDVLDKNTLMIQLCDMFKQDNNLFDRQRFVDACE